MHTGFEYWRHQLNIFYAGNYGRTGGMDFTGKFMRDPMLWPGQARNFRGPKSSRAPEKQSFFLGLPAPRLSGRKTRERGGIARISSDFTFKMTGVLRTP